jgi:hypothetical protein
MSYYLDRKLKQIISNNKIYKINLIDIKQLEAKNDLPSNIIQKWIGIQGSEEDIINTNISYNYYKDITQDYCLPNILTINKELIFSNIGLLLYAARIKYSLYNIWYIENVDNIINAVDNIIKMEIKKTNMH